MFTSIYFLLEEQFPHHDIWCIRISDLPSKFPLHIENSVILIFIPFSLLLFELRQVTRHTIDILIFYHTV